MNLIARRPTLVAALVSLALAAVMVGPALLPGRALSTTDRWWFTAPWSAERPADLTHQANSDLSDASQQFVPLRHEVKRQLPSPPLWNPWIAGGRPLLADAQSAVYSPFSLPAYVMPLEKSLAWTALLTLWTAIFGMYLLGRALGMRFAGALLAGIVYGLNLWLVSHLSYPHSGVWALLPWLLWATERLVRRPTAAAVAVLAVPVGLQYLAGHPETSFQVLLGTVAFFALRVVQARERGVRAPLVAMGAALIAGTALGAVMLAPFVELLLHSADLAERSGTGIGKHVDSTYVLGFFMYDYWGRATETPLLLLLFSRSWYIGALPLMLAAAALIVRPRTERVWIAGFAAVLLAIIFGVPPFVQIGTRLPLLSLGHNDRLILLVLACAALLAGWGLDDLRARELSALAKRAVLVAGTVILIVPLVMVLARSDIGQLFPKLAIKVAFDVASPPPVEDPNAADVVRLAAVVLWVCAAGAALVLLVLRVGGLPQRAFAGLALALVAVDLLRAGMGYNPSIPIEHAEQPQTGALRYLAARGQERFVAVGDIPQNVPALRYRIEDARGYDPPILDRYNKLWRREVSPEYPDLTATLTSYYLQVPRLDERRLRTLRLLGVTSVLAPPESAGAPVPGLDSPGLKRVYNGPDAQVYRVDGALPRAFVAGSQRTVAGGDAALDATTSSSLDARDVAVTERALAGVPEAGEPRAGSARIVRYDPDRVTIEANLERPGVVVLGDNWYPGWKATVDGKPADVERVDYVLRGTVAGAGRHVIDYRYEPASWRIGWILSLLALLSLATAVVVEAAQHVIARRPTLAAALISLALAAIMVGPGLLPGRALSSADIWWFSAPWAAERPADLTRPANADLEDAARAFQPLREEVRRQLPSAPLWDPWITSGRPLLADGQSAVFSPFNVPAWILPLQDSLAWTALLILWAATFGMFLLARALGMRFAGALMAGIVYGLNLWVVAHLSYPHDAVWALLPWVLWATERLVRRPGPASAGLLALVVALQWFGGHPETSSHVILAAIAFFALRVVQSRERGVRAPLLAMAAGLVAGTALAAIVLVPFGELLLHSADLSEREGSGINAHIDPGYLLGFFLYDYWGRGTHTALVPFLFARSWYVGALPLMLAAAALIVRPRAERLWIAGFAALLLAVIFGLPPFVQIATRLPLFSLGHNERLVLLVLACAALLAGWGLDDLLSREAWPRHRRAILIASGLLLALPFVWVLLSGDIDRRLPRMAVEVALKISNPPPLTDAAAADVIRSSALVVWLILAGAGFALIALRLRGLPGCWFAVAALMLVVVDLLRAGMGYNPAIPDDHANLPLTGALRYLADRQPQRFAGVGDGPTAIPQNVPALNFRIADARGNDPPILKRYNKLWRREVSPEVPSQVSKLDFTSPFLQVKHLDERRLRTLRLLGVSHLLVAPESAGPPPEGLDERTIRRVYAGRDAQVFRLGGTLPRAFVAGGQLPVSGADAALDAVTSPSLDARNVAVTEKRVEGVRVATGSTSPAGSARIVRYEPDRVTIDANLTRRGIVVLGDNWYPGWKATVDGKAADVERVDYVLRGTVAGAGHHRIEFRYQPAGWRIGWIVSLLALLGLLASILWKAPWKTGRSRNISTWRTATGGSDRAGASSGR